MQVQNDFLSDRNFLKEANANFSELIDAVQKNYSPRFLLRNESNTEDEISLDFIQKFNDSNEEQQCESLMNVKTMYPLWMYLLSHPACYSCQMFLDELVRLASHSTSVKHHLANSIEDLLFTLTISYDDNVRYGSLKLLALLLNYPAPMNKTTLLSLNRICYETLYDFHVYYPIIEPWTIPSRIVRWKKEEIEEFVSNGTIRPELEMTMNETIEALGGMVFFKMHRSPKDAYPALNKEIGGDWQNRWGLKSTEDPRRYFLRIRSLDQLRLLLKTSDRLREDLQHATTDTHLIFRQWIESLSHEYRCFICHGQLNAISSSDSSSIDVRQFQKILAHIPYSHAIVDCAIDTNRNNQLIIIEINPFTKRADAGKFSWILDREILCDYYKVHGDVYVKYSSSA